MVELARLAVQKLLKKNVWSTGTEKLRKIREISQNSFQLDEFFAQIFQKSNFLICKNF